MKQKIISHKRLLIVILAAILLIAAAVFYYQNSRNHSDEGKNPVAEDGINYSPPTEAEKRETEQHKKDLAEKITDEQSQSSQNSSSGKNADVTMTYIFFENNRISTAGIVNNVFEDGGTCTLILTKGSLKVMASSVGITDVNKTTCPPISIGKNQLQSGQWSAILEYSSSSAKGSSSTRTIDVP